MAVKKRFENDKVVISDIIGEVKGKDVFVIDDEIAKGSTLIELLSHLRHEGAHTVRVACTHGLFTDGALDRLSAQDDILEIVSTNTIMNAAITLEICYHTAKFDIIAVSLRSTLSWPPSPSATSPKRRAAP